MRRGNGEMCGKKGRAGLKAKCAGAAGRELAGSRMALVGLFVGCPGSFGQPGDTGQGEVAIYNGLTAGRVGTPPIVGASTGLSLSRYVVGLFDVSYSPLSNDNLRHNAGLVTTDSRLYDINFSVQVRVPVMERWEPYAT